MPKVEILKQTLAALWDNKLRSFLTMFGIVWGITSVILLVGLGIGFNKEQHERMRGIGTDIAIVWGGQTGTGFGGYVAGRKIDLNATDAIALKEKCGLCKEVSPELRHGVNEVSPTNAAGAPVRGVWPEYQDMRNLELDTGKHFTQKDEDEAARVVILGPKVKDQLFPGANAMGQTLIMEGLPYTVIGILKEKRQNGSYGNGRDDTQLFIPFSSMQRDFPPVANEDDPTKPGLPRGWINNLVVQPVSAEQHEAMQREVYKILGEQHHFDPNDLEALWVWDTLQSAKLVARIFTVMTWFFGAVAVCTLALGGIGVMNIMLVAVTERTREIGIRKALGATRRDIQLQFIAESSIITLLSGLIGLVLGVGVCVAAKFIPLPDFVPHPVISGTAIVASLVTLGLITLFAGTYPARRASDLSPIECLHNE
jgi:putative ABC transport system permease protein